MTIIGILVPWNNEKLIGGSGSSASPFVIALDLANISGLNRTFPTGTIPQSLTRHRPRQCDYLYLGVIHRPVLCICRIPYAYCTRRAALCTQSVHLWLVRLIQFRNRIFDILSVDKSSRPLASLGICLVFGAIAYVNCAPGATGDNVCAYTSASERSFSLTLFSQLAARAFGSFDIIHLGIHLLVPVSRLSR